MGNRTTPGDEAAIALMDAIADSEEWKSTEVGDFILLAAADRLAGNRTGISMVALLYPESQ